MKAKLIQVCAFALAVSVMLSDVRGQTPLGTQFTYQGQLSFFGQPVAGPHDFRFFLYDSAVGGNQLPIGGPITITVDNFNIIDGFLSFVIDFGDMDFQGDARWLQVDVRQTGGPTFFPLAPRTELTITPYALYTRGGIRGAGTPDRIPKFTAGNTLGNSEIFENGGNVGIGTTTPSEKLDVVGSIHASATISSGSSITIDGGSDTITATSGTLSFDNEDLVTTGGITANGLTVNGSVAGTGFSAWDQNASDDLTTSTPFLGDVTGTVGATVVGDDSHDHSDATVSDNLSIDNNRLFAPAGVGNVGIGTVTPSEKLDVAGNIRASGIISSGSSISIDGGTDTITATSGTISFDNEDLVTTGDITANGLTVNGPVAGTGFNGWDTDASDDLTSSTQFQGDVTGTAGAMVVGDDSHDHSDATVSDNLSIDNTRLFAPAGAGNVGIGTNTPGAALEVAGQVKITGGSPGAGKVLTSDADGLASWLAFGDSIPAHAIMFFNLNSCPEGWSPVPDSAGRYIVAMYPGGNPSATVGDPLEIEEDRPTGLHRHFSTFYDTSAPNGAGGIIEGTGTVSTEPLSAQITEWRQEGTIDDPPPGTNSPYIQFCMCQKDK